MRAGMLVLGAVLVAGAPALRAQTTTPQPPAGITLQELEQIAVQNNPTVRAAQAAVDAARARARQAGAWPNPLIGYAADELTPQHGGDPRGTHGVFVEQAFPLGGKLRLGRAVFDRTADEAAARAELQQRRILSSVRTVFYQLLTAQRRIEVHERLAALGSEATGVTAQLFNVGAADRPDFLESEIETRRVQLELTAARNRVFALRQQLAAVVGRPDVAARELAGSIDVALPDLEQEATLQSIIERSPQVAAARAAIARTQAMTALARRQTYPDLFVRGGAGYNRERAGTDGEAVGWEAQIEAGVSIPLFNRNQGGIAAARAEETRAETELQRLELSLRARAASEFATYLTALRSAESFRADILPRAEQAYILYLARYREMAAAYPQVLVAQRSLFEMAREYLEHVDDGWRSALRLQDFLAGEGLEAPGSDSESMELGAAER